MPIYVLSNVPSMKAQRNLGISQRALNQALERLSSGKRINRAADDPSGLLIATRTSLSITAWSSGSANLHMGLDMLSTADSFGTVILEDLQRLYDLANQSNNGLITDAERSLLNQEFRETINEIQRLTINTKFLSQSLLTGDLQNISIKTGEGVSNIVTITISAITTGTTGLAISGISIDEQSLAASALSQIVSAISHLNSVMGVIGTKASAFTKSIDATDALVENLKSSNARLMNADMAAETTNLTNSQIIVQSGISALVQSNSAQTLALALLGNQ